MILRRCCAIALCLVVLGASLAMSRPALAEGDGLSRVRAQTLYVPAYSHLYHGPRERSLLLTVLLSVRNVSMHESITVERVDYYDSDGSLVRAILERPIVLGPLQTKTVVIPEADEAGGSGANFIVRWTAGEPVRPPLVESVMLSTQSQLGVSFRSTATVIEQTP